MIVRFPYSSRFRPLAAKLLVALTALLTNAVAIPTWAVTMTPLATWSPNGDGWLAPGEDGSLYFGIGNTERSIAYGNGHLYLSSRASGNNVRILDAATGADLGGLDMTGVTGGTFVIDGIAVGGDGAIYGANLSLDSTSSPFKVYRWANEVAAPTVVYTGNAGLAGARVGDSTNVFGSGASTLLAFGYGSTPAVAGNNGYAIIDPTASTATAVGFVGTPPNAGDFRLGITFTDSSHVLGAQGSSLYRYTSFSGSSGTLIGSPAIPDPSGATADRLLNYTTIGGNGVLAVQSIGDAHMTVYSAADPGAPVYLASGRNISGTITANGNGTGALAWGDTTVNGDGSISRILYGMSTNSGIQAFVVTLEAPPALVGDYNKDGAVDAADFPVWRRSASNGQGALLPGSGADGSGNIIIGPEDYDVWRAHFGTPGAGSFGAAAVPEPGCCALLLIALVSSMLRRSRRWE